MNKRLILSTALALALGGAMPVLATSTSFAEQAPQPAGSPPWDQTAQQPATPAPSVTPAAPAGQPGSAGPAHHRQHRGPDFAARAAGRIAFIKAKLKITPAQQAAFDKYAQAITDNAQQMQQSFSQMRDQRGKDMSALDRVEQRAKFAQMHDQQEQRYLAAFRPLYDSLSADQKKVADDLASPHRGRFGHWGHPGEHGPQHG